MPYKLNGWQKLETFIDISCPSCSHKEIIISHYNNQLSILHNQSHMSICYNIVGL